MRDRSFVDMDSRRGTTLAAAAPSLRHAAMRLSDQNALRLVADWLSGMPSTSVCSEVSPLRDWPRPGGSCFGCDVVWQSERLSGCMGTAKGTDGYLAAATRIGIFKSQCHPPKPSSVSNHGCRHELGADHGHPPSSHPTAIDILVPALTTNAM
jgi:hypothetical protein